MTASLFTAPLGLSGFHPYSNVCGMLFKNYVVRLCRIQRLRKHTKMVSEVPTFQSLLATTVNIRRYILVLPHLPMTYSNILLKTASLTGWHSQNMEKVEEFLANPTIIKIK
jgi:hypothetical protein